jgi:hypothetical protein
MSWKGCEQKMSQPNFRYHPRILVRGLRKPQAGRLVSRPRFKSDPSRIQVTGVTASSNFLSTETQCTIQLKPDLLSTSLTQRLNACPSSRELPRFILWRVTSSDWGLQAFSSVRPGDYLTSYHNHPTFITTLLLYVPNYIIFASDGISYDRPKCKYK